MLRLAIGERGQLGKVRLPQEDGVRQVMKAPSTSLGWVSYQTSAPTWCLAPLSKSISSDTGYVESFPNSGWGLKKYEEAWNVQSPNSTPALAPALLAQPLPSLPAYLASITYSFCRGEGYHTLPGPAPAAMVWPWPSLHLFETLCDYQHKFLYWYSLPQSQRVSDFQCWIP